MKKLLLILLLIPINVKALDISASCYVVMDSDNKRVIKYNNLHEVRSVASISKIMTAIIAIESGKLDKEVIVGEEINDSFGSGIYIKVKEKMKLKDLVYGLLLRSGNDAALAIAKYVGGSVTNFVKLMNNKALELNMKDTTFNNPSGLDGNNIKGNYSTCYDMALLMSYCINNSKFKEISGTKKYTLKTNMNTYVWHNKNKLLKMYKYTTGGKTGFTKIAKRTLVSSASRNNTNMVIVTFNDGNDFNDHINLYKSAFKKFRSYKILKKGNINIIGEDYYYKDFYIKNDFSYLMEKNEKKDITIKYELKELDNVKDNNVVGSIIVYLGDKIIHKENIYIKNKNHNTLKYKFKEIFNW